MEREKTQKLHRAILEYHDELVEVPLMPREAAPTLELLQLLGLLANRLAIELNETEGE